MEKLFIELDKIDKEINNLYDKRKIVENEIEKQKVNNLLAPGILNSVGWKLVMVTPFIIIRAKDDKKLEEKLINLVMIDQYHYGLQVSKSVEFRYDDGECSIRFDDLDSFNIFVKQQKLKIDTSKISNMVDKCKKELEVYKTIISKATY